MTAARRLAAILAADVGGYSRLMGEDEAGTARAVSEHREAARPIVADHGGRIVKTTGDGLLLEFPSVTTSSFPNILLFTAGAPQQRTNGISRTYRRPYGLLCTALSFANSELLPCYQTG